MNPKNIQEKMFSELEDRTVFNKSQAYGLKYLDVVFDRHVYPTEEAIENLSVFDEELQIKSLEADEVLALLDKYGAPATVPTLGGRYYGFVCGSVLPIGLASKNLGSFWDQSPSMHVLSPIGAKLESVVENWLVDLFSMPEGTKAGFVSGTSAATFCGLAAARYRILKQQGWDINQKGLYGAPKIRIVTGQAHSSVVKAIQLLGFGKENIAHADVDIQGRIIAESFPEIDDNTIVILQAGNVNSGSFDPFDSICDKARKANAWVHIDGAFGLWAEATEKYRYLTKGANKANSWAVDGHKTLNTPYDCGIVMCSDNEAIIAALQSSASYIHESENRNGMAFTIEMSRRARVVELWATMKYLGQGGIDEMVSLMCERAEQFADEIRAADGFVVDNEVVFNQVLVRCESDIMTKKVMKQIQELRECWIGGSSWQGNDVIRVSVCAWTTTREDITRSVVSFKKALALELATTAVG